MRAAKKRFRRERDRRIVNRAVDDPSVALTSANAKTKVAQNKKNVKIFILCKPFFC